MGYKCVTCGMEFPTKREIIEHMIVAHNSPFIEGDWAGLSDTILMKHSELSNQKDMQAKIAHARGTD